MLTFRTHARGWLAWLIAGCVGCSLTDLDSLQGTGGSSTAASTAASGNGGAVGAGGAGIGDGYVGAVMADMPLGYWRLGESRGSAALDRMGEFNGEYFGGLQLGVAGALASDADTAAAFDGNDDRASIDKLLDFSGKQPFSIEAWVKPALPGPLGGAIAGKTWQDGVSGVSYGYVLLSGPAALSLLRRGDVTSEQVDAPPLAVDVFHHVVGRYDGVVLEIYVDGALVASAASAIDLVSHVGTFQIGAQWAHSDLPTAFFVGVIDEVALYPYALSETRIQAHLEAATPR